VDQLARDVARDQQPARLRAEHQVIVPPCGSLMHAFGCFMELMAT
jgi:hypothetical protein